MDDGTAGTDKYHMRKKIYEDVLDDIQEIGPDVREDESAFVTEPFDTKPYGFFVKVHIPMFTITVPAEYQVGIASQISGFIRDVFTDDSIVETISQIYAYGNSDWFGKTMLDGSAFSSHYAGLCLMFGVTFSVRPSFRRCIRFMLRLDAVDGFIRAAVPEIEGGAILTPFDVETIFDGSMMLSTTACILKVRHPVLFSLVSAVNRDLSIRKKYTAACRAMRGCREPEDEKHLIDAAKNIVGTR
jgi:hypothetical protein